FNRIRERRRILRPDQEPGLTVNHELLDGWEPRRDHGDTHRHRFRDGVGNAISISFSRHAAGKDQACRSAHRLSDFVEDKESATLHGGADPQVTCPALEEGPERSVPDDLEREVDAAPGQNADRVEKDVGTLLGYETANRDDTCPISARGHRG